MIHVLFRSLHVGFGKSGTWFLWEADPDMAHVLSAFLRHIAGLRCTGQSRLTADDKRLG